MNREGDFKCLERLEEPVERVNNNDLQTLRTKDVEKRVLLWFEIKENLGKYEARECGSFYGDVHRKTMAGFYMALLKLAATFSTNEERFAEAEKLFTRAEIELVQRLEKYNSFDIKSTEDVISEIRGGDRTTIEYIMDYMNEMKGGWIGVLNDPEIKLPVRDAIKETMKKRLEVLEAGMLELMKQPGGMEGVLREAKVSQQPQQVINIIDSVVQKTSIGGIDLGANSVKRCPGCNREAEKDAKFCPECGTRI